MFNFHSNDYKFAEEMVANTSIDSNDYTPKLGLMYVTKGTKVSYIRAITALSEIIFRVFVIKFTNAFTD